MSKSLRRITVCFFGMPLVLLAAVDAQAERMAFSYTFAGGNENQPWAERSVLFGTIEGTIDPFNSNRVTINSFGPVGLMRPGFPLFVYPPIDDEEFNTFPYGNVPEMSFDGSILNFRSCPSGFTTPDNPTGTPFQDCPFATEGGFLISYDVGFAPSWATAADGSASTVCTAGGPAQGCRVSDIPIQAANWSLAVLPPPTRISEVADVNGNNNTDVGVLLRDSASNKNKLLVMDGGSGKQIKTVAYGSFPVRGSTTVHDADGDQVPEFGVLLEGSLFARVKNVVNRSLLGEVSFDPGFDPVAFLSVGEAGGDVGPDVAVVGRDESTTKVRAQVMDVASGALVRLINFPAAFVPFAAVVLDNIGDSPALEIAVLGIDATGKVQATIKDAGTGNLVGKVSFSRKFVPLFFAAVPDASGKLTSLAVLGRDASGVIQAQVKRASDGSKVSNVKFNKKNVPRAFISFADSNGSGSGELVVIGQHDTGKVQAQAKEIADGSLLRNIIFSRKYPPADGIAVNGVAGTGRNEIAVLGKNITGQYNLQIRDLLTGALVNNIPVNFSLDGAVVDAGSDFSVDERSMVVLYGFTNRPLDVQSVNWVQTAGPNATITDGTTLQPRVELPSIVSDATVTLRLDINFKGGGSLSDSVDIDVMAFPNIADANLADPVLQQCVDDAAAAGGLVEVPELTSLNCGGVSDAGGFDFFTGITMLELPNNSLKSLQTLIGMDNLQFLDISGNPGLPCAEVDILAQRLVEGVSLLVDDICLADVTVELFGAGFDAAIDEVREQVYISIPDRNELAVVSLTDLRVIDRISLPGSPYGIDLSIDETRVFAALHGSTAVASINIDQRTVDTISLGNSTGDARTYDVVEGATDRLFVSASPGSSGFAYIAQVRLDQGNVTSRAADSRIIRASPVFARSPDTQFVYVGEGFSPNSLYKLSLLDPDAGIVLEDNHGSVSGTSNLVLNSTGSRISLRSGQVLRTGSFIEEGLVSDGVTAASPVTDTLFVARPAGGIESWDFTTLQLADTISTGCSNGTTDRIMPFDNDQSFMLLQGSEACIYTGISRSTPADPFAALRFPDLALEACVVDAATNAGFTQPDEFVQLDCSAAAGSILSLDTIERMVNLELLDVSNSGVFDLSPLTTMTSLQSLVVRDAAVTDVSPLFNLGSLGSFDARGNDSIPCDDLNQLVTAGVSVQADLCTQGLRVELGGIGADLVVDESNDRAFVSIPSLQQVAEIRLSTATVADRHILSGAPYGIDLGDDDLTIYAALNGLGDIAYLNVNDGSVETVDISTELDDDRTWDIAEVSANRIVVSSNPGSSGFAYIVEVRRDQANAATRVASNRIIRAAPVFAVSQDELSVYVGEGFSPNSLYKLDATQASLPIVLEDDHGAVSGTDSLALSPDGTRIYLRSGQTLATDTFIQVGQFSGGRSTVSGDGTKLLIGDGESDAAGVYDAATSSKTGRRAWGCDILTLQALQELGGDGIIALGDDLVCFSEQVNFP